MNKGLNSLCDSLVDWFFFPPRPGSHAKFPGKWPYWRLKVCPKLGPCLCWGQRGAHWLSIKKEVNIQMSRRQVADVGWGDESGWTWGSSGALFLWADVSQLQLVLLLWWFHAAVGLWGRGGDALLHVKGTWEITNTKTVFWECLQRGRTKGHPSWLLLGCWRFWETCWVWVVELPVC